jgi:protein gp37
LDHLWLGYSVCTQKDAEDVYYLLKTPAKIRFLSCEPVLEDIDLSEYLSEFIGAGICNGCGEQRDILYAVDAAPVAGLAICTHCTPQLSWCIIGGESGHNARVCHIEHLRSLLNQCQKTNIPPFIKQLGAKPILNNQPYKISDKKGGILSEFPEDLQIREFPNV